VENVTRLVLIDDHPVLREGLVHLLHQEPDFKVCAYAEDADTAFEAVAQHRPSIAIVDLTLPGGDGVVLTRKLREAYPDLRILVLSAHEEAIYAEHLLRAGANGYVMKGAPGSEIVRALRSIRDTGSYLSSAAIERFVGRTSGRQPASGKLSPREAEVVALLSQGMTMTAIAHKLGINSKTAYVHADRARKKLGLDSMLELTRYAMLVDDEKR
jgi:DNA-binding NarL/FixJ family response regulator